MAIETEKKYLDYEGLQTLVDIINNKFDEVKSELSNLNNKIERIEKDFQVQFDDEAQTVVAALANLEELTKIVTDLYKNGN